MEMGLKTKITSNIRHRAGYLSLKFCPLSSNGKGKFAKNYFYWEFEAKPTKFSKIYYVLLIWDFQFVAPRVYILNNELRKVELIKRIPHLYCREKMHLCLYYPEYKEFNLYMPLCKTIIPWTYRWLQYYEEWLYSGEWKGGDAPHPTISRTDDADSIQESYKVKKTLSDIIYTNRKKTFDNKKVQNTAK